MRSGGVLDVCAKETCCGQFSKAQFLKFVLRPRRRNAYEYVWLGSGAAYWKQNSLVR